MHWIQFERRQVWHCSRYYRQPQSHAVSCRAISKLRIFKKVKKKRSIALVRRAVLVLVGIKSATRRKWWESKTGRWQRRRDYRAVANQIPVWWSLHFNWTLFHKKKTYTINHKHTQFALPQNWTCTGIFEQFGECLYSWICLGRLRKSAKYSA